MTTGNHTVRDIYCVKCGTTLGWKYVSAPQKAKNKSSRRLWLTPFIHRIRLSNRPRSTRKANLFSSGICWWMFSSYCAPAWPAERVGPTPLIGDRAIKRYTIYTNVIRYWNTPPAHFGPWTLTHAAVLIPSRFVQYDKYGEWASTRKLLELLQQFNCTFTGHIHSFSRRQPPKDL